MGSRSKNDSMTNIRLSRGLCAVVGSALRGSHATLDALFVSAGAPGEPPNLSHGAKWKEWLFRAGQDPAVDSLRVLGNILEEFMDVAPQESEARLQWESDRKRVNDALETDGMRYYQGGRVLPNGEVPLATTILSAGNPSNGAVVQPPSSIDELLTRVVRGLPRAMYPLIKRRKGAAALTFRSEYDLQDLLHALLRPWVADIRAEEFTPSYAGSSARMDFLLPAHSLVIELKYVRDHTHAKNIGKELTIDIAHYRAHKACGTLWCVIYDPDKLIPNIAGLAKDLEGMTHSPQGTVTVKLEVIS